MSLTDPEIRALLRPCLPPGIVLDEIEIRGGGMGPAFTDEENATRWATVRADVVVVGDMLHGYEVKSARDSRVRLPRQVAGYSGVFDFCTLVTEPKHLDAALALLPPWWGVLVVGDGAVRVHRAGEQHIPEPGPLVRMLWKDEVRRLYRAHGLRVKPKEYIHDMWRRAGEVPLDALRAAVRETLRDHSVGLDDRRREQREARMAQAARERKQEEQRRALFARSFRAAAHAWFARRTGPRFDDTMYCVHCSADVAIPLSKVGGETDHWLSDGQEIACDACGGVNTVTADAESEAYFAECEDERCAACEKGATT